MGTLNPHLQPRGAGVRRGARSAAIAHRHIRLAARGGRCVKFPSRARALAQPHLGTKTTHLLCPDAPQRPARNACANRPV